jgi:hypothetical protein
VSTKRFDQQAPDNLLLSTWLMAYVHFGSIIRLK